MKKAVFLDRDGVINEVMSERVKFVNRKEDLYLLDGVSEAISNFCNKGYSVFVVTNQGGVGLGFMKSETLDEIHEHMKNLIASEFPDAVIDEVISCTHKPKSNCSCRKPSPGMLYSLSKTHGIDLSQSYMIGDMETDVEAGLNAGVKTILLTEEKVETKANYVARTLLDAVKFVS